MQHIVDRKKQPKLKSIEKIDIKRVEDYRLDNGIPVYYINAGFQDLVKIELVFRNLAYDPSKPLLSSATNRMLAEGTRRHTALQLADMIDYYGAFYSTEESVDHCSLELFTLNKHLGRTLPAFREILTEAIFPEKELSTFILNNTQRILVENEKVMTIARKKFNELLFGERHPYGHASTTQDYAALNSKDLLDYHKRQYISEHCTIIVSGKVNSSTLSLINSHLGDKTWSRSNGAMAKTPEPDTKAPGKYVVGKEGAIQSAIRIGKKMFNRTHPDYPGFSMLNTVLGGYFGSRLMSNIREDKGYTYGINSGMVSMRDHGYFTIGTEVGSEVTRQAIDEIYKEMKILCEEEIGPEELETVRNYLLGSFIKNLETAFHLSDRFKTIHLQGLDYDYYERYLNKIRTIQPAELLQLAQHYLDPDSMTELVVGPK